MHAGKVAWPARVFQIGTKRWPGYSDYGQHENVPDRVLVQRLLIYVCKGAQLGCTSLVAIIEQLGYSNHTLCLDVLSQAPVHRSLVQGESLVLLQHMSLIR